MTEEKITGGSKFRLNARQFIIDSNAVGLDKIMDHMSRYLNKTAPFPLMCSKCWKVAYDEDDTVTGTMVNEYDLFKCDGYERDCYRAYCSECFTELKEISCLCGEIMQDHRDVSI